MFSNFIATMKNTIFPKNSCSCICVDYFYFTFARFPKNNFTKEFFGLDPNITSRFFWRQK